MKNMLRKVRFTLEKNAPDILLGIGVVSVVGGGVFIGKASTTLLPKIEELKYNLKLVDDSIEKKVNGYTEEQAQKDKLFFRLNAAKAIGISYLPAVGFGLVGLGCILKSHMILKNRMMSVNAALVTVSAAFVAYKARVAEAYGEEAERDIRYGITHEEYEETETNAKGKEKIVKKTRTRISKAESPFSEFFMQGNEMWEKDFETNLLFLQTRQNYANNLLKVKGKLCLNVVRDMLGFEETDEGMVMGWIYDPENPDCAGDNYIDFGIEEYTINTFLDAEDIDAGYTPEEPVLLLDFNVDEGMIWGKKPVGKGAKK